MAIGQFGTLDDGASQTEIAEGLRQAKADIREHGHAEVRRREEACEQHTNGELGECADDRAPEPPPGGARCSCRETVGH